MEFAEHDGTWRPTLRPERSTTGEPAAREQGGAVPGRVVAELTSADVIDDVDNDVAERVLDKMSSF